MVCLPAGHLSRAVQESVLVLLLDTASLKNPAAHASHWGWAVAVPATLVYLPAGQLVWAMQAVSVLSLVIDLTALNFPAAHATHSGWAVAEPTFMVYLPAGHVVWTAHQSFEQPGLKNTII